MLVASSPAFMGGRLTLWAGTVTPASVSSGVVASWPIRRCGLKVGRFDLEACRQPVPA
jgi:hypothetical protein